MSNIFYLMSFSYVTNEGKNPSMQQVFSESGKQAFHLGGLDGKATSIVPILGKIMNFLNIALIGMFLLGLYYLVFSNLGNNGNARWRGANTLISTYSVFIFFHIFMVMLVSYANITGGQKFAFFLMLLGEMVFMVASLVLYAYGVIHRQIYIMTGQPEQERLSDRDFTSLKTTIIGATFCVLLGVFFR